MQGEIVAVARRMLDLLTGSAELVIVVAVVVCLTIALLAGAGSRFGVWMEDLIYRFNPSHVNQED